MSDEQVETAPAPEYDRRTKQGEKFHTHLLGLLFAKQGRKVAFGVWLFIVADSFKARSDMPWNLWWNCVLLSAAMIGFGTILDSVVSKFGDAVAAMAGDRLAVMLKKRETNVQPDPSQPQS